MLTADRIELHLAFPDAPVVLEVEKPRALAAPRPRRRGPQTDLAVLVACTDQDFIRKGGKAPSRRFRA